MIIDLIYANCFLSFFFFFLIAAAQHKALLTEANKTWPLLSQGSAATVDTHFLFFYVLCLNAVLLDLGSVCAGSFVDVFQPVS